MMGWMRVYPVNARDQASLLCSISVKSGKIDRKLCHGRLALF